MLPPIPQGGGVVLAPALALAASGGSGGGGGSLIRPEAAARAAELLAGSAMGSGARARSGSASGGAALAAGRPSDAGSSAFTRPALGAAGPSLRNVAAGGAGDPTAAGPSSVTRQVSASNAAGLAAGNAGGNSGGGGNGGSAFSPIAPAGQAGGTAGTTDGTAAIDRKPSQLGLPLAGAAGGAAGGAVDADKANAAVAAATAAAERAPPEAPAVPTRPGATARPLPQDSAAERAGRRWGASSGGVVAATKAFDAQLAAVQLRIPGDASATSATDYAIAAHIANRASEARLEARHTWSWPYRLWRALLDRLVLTTTFALAILLVLIGALLHQVYPDRTIAGSPAWQWLYLVGALVAALLPLTVAEWAVFALLERAVSCCGVVGAEVLSFAYCAKGHLAHIGVIIFALDVRCTPTYPACFHDCGCLKLVGRLPWRAACLHLFHVGMPAHALPLMLISSLVSHRPSLMCSLRTMTAWACPSRTRAAGTSLAYALVSPFGYCIGACALLRKR